MKSSTVAVIALVLLGTVCEVRAQETRRVEQVVTVYELALRDGSRLYGSIVREDESAIVFRTEGGTTVTVARREILSLRQTTGLRIDGEFQPSDPNATRLFFGPTGRSLRRGQVYLGVYEFVLPFVQVGVTDRFSIGGGTPLTFGEGAGFGNRPYWVTPKLQVFNADNTQLSVGVFHGFCPCDDGGAGIAYVVGTHGTAVSSFTVGAGMGYAGGGRAGIVMLGGERQVARSAKLITENYYWKGGGGLVSGGVRFFGERLSADLSLFMPINEGFLIAPLVNFVYIF